MGKFQLEEASWNRVQVMNFLIPQNVIEQWKALLFIDKFNIAAFPELTKRPRPCKKSEFKRTKFKANGTVHKKWSELIRMIQQLLRYYLSACWKNCVLKNRSSRCNPIELDIKTAFNECSEKKELLHGAIWGFPKPGEEGQVLYHRVMRSFTTIEQKNSLRKSGSLPKEGNNSKANSH